MSIDYVVKMVYRQMEQRVASDGGSSEYMMKMTCKIILKYYTDYVICHVHRKINDLIYRFIKEFRSFTKFLLLSQAFYCSGWFSQ